MEQYHAGRPDTASGFSKREGSRLSVSVWCVPAGYVHSCKDASYASYSSYTSKDAIGMVAIIDYGIGNVLAIQNIIKKAGGKSVVTDDLKIIESADKIILPGVGSFSYGLAQLRSRNLIPFLEDQVFQKQKVILGLCLGAQLMTCDSEEGNCKGLGWVSASTKKFNAELVSITPHMNWADVRFIGSSPLSEGMEQDARFYFVHSYHFDFFDEKQIIGTAHYGYEFSCAFQHKNIFGVQFHPEKSHRFGIKLFQNFLSI
jgi:glutamine amidotransferase